MSRVLHILWLLGIAVLLGGPVSSAQAPAPTTGMKVPELELVRQLNELIGKARFTEAIPCAQELVTRCEKDYGASHTNPSDTFSRLAEIYGTVSDYTDSAALYSRALEIRGKLLGLEHPDTAAALRNLVHLGCSMCDDAKSDHFTNNAATAPVNGDAPTVLKALLRDLENSQHFPKNDAVVVALVNIGTPAVDFLIELLQSQNRIAREKAAQALGRIRDKRALKPLIEAWRLRNSYAGTALLAYGDLAIPPLVEHLQSDGSHGVDAVRILTTIGKSAVPALIDALSFNKHDRRDLIKGNIAQELAALGAKDAIGPLQTLFYHHEESVREKCYDALIKLGWQAHTPNDKALVLLTSPRNNLVRGASRRNGDPDNVAQCANIGRDAFQLVVRLLKHSDYEVRNRACRVLEIVKDDLAVGPLIELFRDDARSRDAAGKALVAIGSNSVIALTQLLKDNNSDVAQAASKYLGETPADAPLRDLALDGLLAALKSKDEYIRNATVSSLGHFDSDRAVDAICSAMQAREFYARVNNQKAAAALSKIGQRSVLPILNVIAQCQIQRVQQNDDIAKWCASALGDIGDSRAVDALHRLAMNNWDRNGNVSSASIRALARIGKPSLNALISISSSTDRFVRVSAINGLKALHRTEKLSDPQMVIALFMRLNDADQIVRTSAVETLKEITGAATTQEVFIRYVYSQVDQRMTSNALTIALSYQDFVQSNISQMFGFASERQRLFYMSSLNDIGHPCSILAAVGRAESLAESVVHLKGIVLDSLLEDIQMATRSDDPSVNTLVDQLKKAKSDLHSVLEGSPSSKRRDSEQRVAQLESQLSRHLAAAGKTRRTFAIGVPQVQAPLPTNTVLLEFILYSHYLGNGKFEPRYGVVLIGNAMVALNGAKVGEPLWVPLGLAEAIERNLQEYGAIMRGEKRGELNLLHALHTQLFAPIQSRLPQGITTLIVSPDAELNFLSFATLADAQGKFLAEQYTILYVSSGRDLVLGATGQTRSRHLAAFANPAFSERPAAPGPRGTNAVRVVTQSTDRRDYAGMTLGPLPNTAQEVQFLQERSSTWNLQGTVHAGAVATEAEVKSVKSPHILHLATHGFFLPDTLPTNRPPMGMQLLGGSRTPVVFHNPMQRSGLAFAGAQLTLDAWKRGETPETENDGILMAQEVGTMNLKGTWLVVLSACDTGMGEARAGEGVLGLRRGFIEAGTQNLLMTLWPVSDRWTMEMMKSFYERALQDGDAPRALAAVQREYLVKLRAEKNAMTAARLAGPFVMTFQGALNPVR